MTPPGVMVAIEYRRPRRSLLKGTGINVYHGCNAHERNGFLLETADQQDVILTGSLLLQPRGNLCRLEGSGQ